MIHFRYNLRRHVSWCTTEGVDSFALGTSQTKPKVNKFQFLVTVDKDVFSFYISVDDVSAMKVL